jgi:hemolysin-activating ACP:hemolysin acyltransferase
MALWSKKREADNGVTEELANAIGVGKHTSVEAPPQKPPADQQASVRQPPSAPEPQQPSIVDRPQPLGQRELRQRAAESKNRMALFGEIVTVFMRSPQFRAMPLAELDALVVPAVVNNQFFLMETRSKENGYITPIGVALWAAVSADVDHRLSTNLDQPMKLAPNEWKSGNIAWLVATAGDARAVSPILQRFCETTLKGSPLKLRTKDKEGRTMVGAFSAAASNIKASSVR